MNFDFFLGIFFILMFEKNIFLEENYGLYVVYYFIVIKL